LKIILDSFKEILILGPKTGFQIAFKMFDTDGNDQVDKKEFLVVSLFLKIFKLINY
jgi:hypothetical protein